MEVKVVDPMFHQGKPVKPGEVIDLPQADAQYLIGIGRVESIDEVVAKPVKRTKAKSQESEA